MDIGYESNLQRKAVIIRLPLRRANIDVEESRDQD
jgi:hypothetical protein